MHPHCLSSSHTYTHSQGSNSSARDLPFKMVIGFFQSEMLYGSEIWIYIKKSIKEEIKGKEIFYFSYFLIDAKKLEIIIMKINQMITTIIDVGLLSQGRRHTTPQTDWLTRGLRSGCQGESLWGLPGWPPTSSGAPRCGCACPISLCAPKLPISISYEGHQWDWMMAHSNHLILSHLPVLQNSLQIDSPSEQYRGWSMEHMNLGKYKSVHGRCVG